MLLLFLIQDDDFSTLIAAEQAENEADASEMDSKVAVLCGFLPLGRTKQPFEQPFSQLAIAPQDVQRHFEGRSGGTVTEQTSSLSPYQQSQGTDCAERCVE